MAKYGKRTRSDWMIAQALNRVKCDGRTVYMSSDTYEGRPKPKTLYRIELFKDKYYVLCIQNRVIILFSTDMVAGGVRRGGLVFRDQTPFKELASFYQ